MNSRYDRTTDDEALAAPDAARTDIYAIIGRFFYRAPEESLLAALKQADDEEARGDAALGTAWRVLREACVSVEPAALAREFDSLFAGVGKSEITPFTSHYVKEGAPDRHLVQLRRLLASWNLQGSSATGETEDHVAGICDVMRHLISDHRPLDEQLLFFNEFLYPGLAPFCEAILRSDNASFYRCVAQFTLAFLTVERAAFEMEDG